MKFFAVILACIFAYVSATNYAPDHVCYKNHCDVNAKCIPHESGEYYNCKCNIGYEGKGSVNTCKKIECSKPMDLINGYFTAVKEAYFYLDYVTYSCKEGFRLHGQAKKTCKESKKFEPTTTLKCSDIDECTEKKHNCNEKASCHNTEGSFSCTCNKGYEGNGQECKLIKCSKPSFEKDYQVIGQLKHSYLPEQKVLYRCQRYRSLKIGKVYTKYITCQKNKSWTKPSGCGSRQCSQEECRRPFYRNGYTYDNRCWCDNYRCRRPGFQCCENRSRVCGNEYY